MISLDTVAETTEEFDAIVIGSGITGGWAAKELCERGYRTLMIERGRMIEHRKDYQYDGVPEWQQPFRGKVDKQLSEHNQSVQQKSYAYNQANHQYYGNDRDLPYSTADGTDFGWIRANQLGGRSLLWARQCYRWSDDDFKANQRDGIGGNWPIDYADVAPWYARIEKYIGLSGAYDGLSQLPDGDFLPPFEMTNPELAFKATVQREFENRHVIIARTANLTKPTVEQLAGGRVACQARNECDRGCSFGAYFSTQSSTLPAAAKTGKLQIAPNSVVHSLIYDAASNRVRGVRVVDNEDLSEREYSGKLVFLCASTLGSTQILLNSATERFPNGLANSSGVLGHYLMDHNFNAYASARIPGFSDDYYRGRRPTSCYMPNHRFKPSLYSEKYRRGYAWGFNTYRESWGAKVNKPGFGADFKRSIAQVGDWKIAMWAQGEMLPSFDNTVSLHPKKKDKWGIPQLHFDVRWSDNDKAMMADAVTEADAMLSAAGYDDIKTGINGMSPGFGNHEVGTARMGADPKTSVFNGFGQSHDIPNLFCTDGATFCSVATQNPSLTFMALTARAVDFAANEFRNRRV